jgi:hypothetical protein
LADKYFFRYSTPSDYIDAIAKNNILWPTKYDDMFPYSDNKDAYWTGYFSSRPNFKEYIRRASSAFHAQNQLIAMAVLDNTINREAVELLLNATYRFMDVMGIEQHHDAVSGTSLQSVEQDYAKKIYRVMEENAGIYSALIENEVNKFAGLASNETWLQCQRTNSSVHDCPISFYLSNHTRFPVTPQNFTMTVAIQNPSSLDLKQSKILVPHGNFKVEKFCSNHQTFEPANSEVSCFPKRLSNGVEIQNCALFVNNLTPAREISLFRLTPDPEVNLTLPLVDAQIGDSI